MRSKWSVVGVARFRKGLAGGARLAGVKPRVVLGRYHRALHNRRERPSELSPGSVKTSRMPK